jgi:hypothetical protein
VESHLRKGVTRSCSVPDHHVHRNFIKIVFWSACLLVKVQWLLHGALGRVMLRLPGAQVLFTAELRRRLPGDCGIVAAAVHPGEVMTDVVRTLPGLMQSAYRLFMRPFCLTPAQGASSLPRSPASPPNADKPAVCWMRKGTGRC